ncbi:DUF5908 family protein [Cochleicola gelatinilyticus]|uniref:DUF5908 family protein n=1 Tax=Cochleicola gelatinilyticus TaxID=1763537 RepID=UPI001F51A8DD|nr:DUF5908 family protein [Cochleicola gelatinilyticus]
MPIEIKELNIKIKVNDYAQTNATPNKESGDKTSKLIESCVEQVMRIQQRKNER